MSQVYAILGKNQGKEEPHERILNNTFMDAWREMDEATYVGDRSSDHQEASTVVAEKQLGEVIE